MKVIDDIEIERLVREAFPEKRAFSAGTDLGVSSSRPVVAFVHGGPDPFLDRQFEAPGGHSGEQDALPALGAPEKGYAPLAAAPGTYVLAR